MSKLSAHTQRTTLIAGAAVTALVILSLFLLYWNHFVGMRAGGGQFIAWSWMLNQGFLPYKDYYLPTPLFYIFRGSALLSLFGDHFIALRICGVVERIVLAVLIYFWLARFFKKSIAAPAAITTVILGSCDPADPLDVYSQEAILWSVVSGLSASYILDGKRTARATLLLSLLSGTFAGLSLMTKQSIGLGITMMIPAIMLVCLYRLDGWRTTRTFLIGYIGGWFFCTGLFILWLVKNGILPNFFEQIFITGPSAKAANLSVFLKRFVKETFLTQDPKRSLYLFGSIVGLWLAWLLPQRLRTPESSDAEPLVKFMIILLAGLGAVGVGAYLGYAWSETAMLVFVFAFFCLYAAMSFVFYATGSLCLIFPLRWVRHGVARQEAQLFLYAGVSFADALMVSLSFPFYQVVLIPGLGLMLAAILTVARSLQTKIIYTTCAILVTGTTVYKLRVPYLFEDFFEPPATVANCASVLPQLKGFILPKSMVSFIDDTVRIIRNNTTPEDTIYVYPEGALFYPLANRRCPTFSMSHNMDTTNDQLAKSEAALLLSKRPAVLVYYRSSDAVMRMLESLWRQGRPSGNRHIMAACETLAKQYRLVKTFEIPNGLNRETLKVMVYVRPLREIKKIRALLP